MTGGEESVLLEEQAARYKAQTDALHNALADQQILGARVVELITRHGGSDEAHHLKWVIDQIAHTLLGDYGYAVWVDQLKAAGHKVDPGIAP